MFAGSTSCCADIHVPTQCPTRSPGACLTPAAPVVASIGIRTQASHTVGRLAIVIPASLALKYLTALGPAGFVSSSPSNQADTRQVAKRFAGAEVRVG
jgi:hypothetical protein